MAPWHAAQPGAAQGEPHAALGQASRACPGRRLRARPRVRRQEVRAGRMLPSSTEAATQTAPEAGAGRAGPVAGRPGDPGHSPAASSAAALPCSHPLAGELGSPPSQTLAAARTAAGEAATGNAPGSPRSCPGAPGGEEAGGPRGAPGTPSAAAVEVTDGHHGAAAAGPGQGERDAGATGAEPAGGRAGAASDRAGSSSRWGAPGPVPLRADPRPGTLLLLQATDGSQRLRLQWLPRAAAAAAPAGDGAAAAHSGRAPAGLAPGEWEPATDAGPSAAAPWRARPPAPDPAPPLPPELEVTIAPDRVRFAGAGGVGGGAGARVLVVEQALDAGARRRRDRHRGAPGPGPAVLCAHPQGLPCCAPGRGLAVLRARHPACRAVGAMREPLQGWHIQCLLRVCRGRSERGCPVVKAETNAHGCGRRGRSPIAAPDMRVPTQSTLKLFGVDREPWCGLPPVQCTVCGRPVMWCPRLFRLRGTARRRGRPPARGVLVLLAAAALAGCAGRGSARRRPNAQRPRRGVRRAGGPAAPGRPRSALGRARRGARPRRRARAAAARARAGEAGPVGVRRRAPGRPGGACERPVRGRRARQHRPVGRSPGERGWPRGRAAPAAPARARGRGGRP